LVPGYPVSLLVQNLPYYDTAVTAAVTSVDIEAAIQKLIDPENMLVGTAGPYGCLEFIDHSQPK
jgi:predicted Zn-dependent peptidase